MIYARILAGLLFVTFAGLGLLSDGLLSDDDLGRLNNVLRARQDPEMFVSSWNRPAFVLLYFLPAQLGPWAVEILTAAVTALAGYMSFAAARHLREPNAWTAVFLVGLQPFVVLLSFSVLTEPLAALLLAVALERLYSGHRTQSAVWVSLLPLARMELTPLLLVWAFTLFRDRSLRSALWLPLGLVLWNLAGAAITGDPLYLVHDLLADQERAYQPIALSHYPTMFIFIVGPVVFFLASMGLTGLRRRRRLVLIPVAFGLMFLIYVWLAFGVATGQSAGFLRHFVAIAPLSGLLALRGLNVWLSRKRSPLRLALLVGVPALVGLWLSYRLHDLFSMGSEAEYSKLAIVTVLAALGLAIGWVRPGKAVRRFRAIMVGIALVAAAGYAFIPPPVVRPHAEARLMEKVAAAYLDRVEPGTPTLCNHPWFFHHAGADPFDSAAFPTLNHKEMDAAPLGSFAIWEGHYSARLRGDVAFEDILADRRYRTRQNFIGPKGRHFAVLLEKVGERGEDRFTLDANHYYHEGLGVRWEPPGGLGPEWTFEPKLDGLNLLQGRHPGPEGGPGETTISIQLDRWYNRSFGASIYGQFLKGALERSGGQSLSVRASEPGPRENTWILLAQREDVAFFIWAEIRRDRKASLQFKATFPSESWGTRLPELMEMAQHLHLEPGWP